MVKVLEAVTSRASAASLWERALSLGAVASSSAAHYFKVLFDATGVFLVKFQLMQNALPEECKIQGF